jgi:hypothetical protein
MTPTKSSRPRANQSRGGRLMVSYEQGDDGVLAAIAADPPADSPH